MRGISKKLFLDARQCMTRGWFARRQRRPEPPSDAVLFRMQEGQRIGELARTLYPGGVLVKAGNTSQAIRQTQRLMKDGAVPAIFEATFRAGECTAKVDILVPKSGGLKVLEVKSNLHSASRKLEDLRDDLAYTCMVASRAGVSWTAASLLLVSRNYRRSMGPEALFAESNETAAVQERVPGFKKVAAAIQRATKSPSRPKPTLRSACKACRFFKSSCLGKGIEHPVTELPNIGARIANLPDADLRVLPRNTPLSAKQRRVAEAVWEGTVFCARDLGRKLSQVTWPAYYLDFETTATALPLYDGVAPYEQLPTQYSLHRCDRLRDPDEHFEYLADPDRDCRRELATHLLGHLGAMGSIVVYGNFESATIRSLANLYPDLADALNALVPRLYDLHPVVAQGYYQAEFHGRYSIKHVLPALVPELTYDGLDIQDGFQASAAFARMALGEYTDREQAQVRQGLLTYCKLDTLAMIRLHERLDEIVKQR
jgi:CRISPR/Cas system-associated exonuclease Cas4 (RecB family)